LTGDGMTRGDTTMSTRVLPKHRTAFYLQSWATRSVLSETNVQKTDI